MNLKEFVQVKYKIRDQESIGVIYKSKKEEKRMSVYVK